MNLAIARQLPGMNVDEFTIEDDLSDKGLAEVLGNTITTMTAIPITS